VLVTGTSAPTRSLPVTGKVVIAAVPTSGAGQPDPRARRLLRALAGAQPAALLIPVDAPDAVWPTVVRGAFRSALAPTWERDVAAPVVQVRDAVVATALRQAGINLGAARREVGAARMRPLGIDVALAAPGTAIETDHAPNVAGLLRGSDPALRDEVVVISAHMDHVGVTGRGLCRAVGADSICNGADDNASGTASVVELAEAFAALTPRPRRSLLFVTVSGEERGLWGSDYFTAHPPVPVARMVADLNLDMVGRNWRDTIAVIGREHSDLGATLARVEAAHPELDMHAVGDLWPNERFYFRSDHYNFARRGVPILFFFNGTHPDYHRPSDEPQKIDAEKQARLTRLIYYLAREIADAPDRPTWVPESYDEIVGR
jgi:Zn-dependent M28 family amino/carboxypeptidase